MMLENVYIYTHNIDTYSAQIKVIETFKNFEAGSLVITEVFDPRDNMIKRVEHYCQEKECILYMDIAEPELWYPRPYGEQPIYTLKITIGNKVFFQRFGIRTVKILKLNDKDEVVVDKCRTLQKTISGVNWDQNEEYTGFILIINNKKIYCTGANWVPCEPFPAAESEEKITKIMEMAVDAGINMIRVWGGGLFEIQHLYDECDRLGIMVTQDFLMACGNYPEREADFQDHLKREAEFAAIYLRNHPSLVWWTGDNENAVDGCDTDINYPGRISARKVIAPVLERLDYNREFLPSSPYGGKKYASKTAGTTHNTQFLSNIFEYIAQENISDYREYWKEYTARFIAEEPSMGAVCKQSLNTFVALENQDNYDMWLYHTKTNPALGRELMDIIVDFAEKLFGTYIDMEDRYFKLRYLQYEWVRFTLGNARSNIWFNSGIVYWMLNDCWPAAIGWSILDYYNRPKTGYYAMKNYGQKITVYIEKSEENGYLIHVSNILNQSQREKMSLKAFVVDLKKGSEISQCLLEKNISIPLDKVSQKVDVKLHENEIFIAEIKGNNFYHRNWYKDGIPKLVRSEALQWRCSDSGIEVWSDKYIHVVEIEAAEQLEDNYFSLLPGEKRSVAYDKLKTKEKVFAQGYTFV